MEITARLTGRERRELAGLTRPRLAICGPGRCGKDTAADWFRDNTVLRSGGCSWAARHYMAARLSADIGIEVTADEAFERRHDDRMKWFTYLNEWREGDPARLARMVLAEADIVTGIRAAIEYQAARAEGLIDLAIWIERPGLPVDPTMEYGRDECDIVIYNDADIRSFYGRLDRLARVMGVMKLERCNQPWPSV